jgi:hypothetical protein
MIQAGCAPGETLIYPSRKGKARSEEQVGRPKDERQAIRLKKINHSSPRAPFSSFRSHPTALLFRPPLSGFEHLTGVDLIAFEGRTEGVPESWFLNFSARFYSLEKGAASGAF